MKLDACYNWPTCSDAAVARAVELDAPDGKPLKDDLHGAPPGLPGVRQGRRRHATSRAGSPARTARCSRRRAACAFPARGLARVGRMLLNGGTLDGVRILSPQSVETLLDPGLALRRHATASRAATKASTAATAWRPSRSRHRSRLRRRHGHARAQCSSATPAMPTA